MLTNSALTTNSFFSNDLENLVNLLGPAFVPRVAAKTSRKRASATDKSPATAISYRLVHYVTRRGHTDAGDSVRVQEQPFQLLLLLVEGMKRVQRPANGIARH